VQTHIDDLTSLANRRGWDAELADVIAGSTPACVAADRLLQCASESERQIR
jgi:hypothetical protein